MTRLSPPPGARAPRRAWLVLLVTAVAVFMSFLDVTIVNIAFPDLRADFDSSRLATLSWVLNGYSIVFAAALVPIGGWADRIGRKRVFLAGVLVFVLASAASGLSPTPEFLIAARVAQALGAAALVPTSLALLLPEFPVSQRATATAIWGASGAVAAAAGPSLGGLLVAWGGWRWVFFVNVPIGIAALLPAQRLLPDTAPGRGTARRLATTGPRGAAPGLAPRPDLAGAVVLAAGVGALSLAIVQGPDWGWSDPSVIGSAVAGVVLLAAFVVRSAQVSAPVVDLRLFRVRSFAAANAGLFAFSLGFFALLLCNVLFLTTQWRYGVLRAGVALTPGPIMAAVFAPLGGRLSDRYGQRVVAVPGLSLFAAGAALLALAAPANAHYVTGFLPATLLTGAGVGLSISSLGSAAVAELPFSQFATGSAVNACVRQIGSVIGIATLLAVLGDSVPAPGLPRFQHAWWAVAGTAVTALACAAALGRVRARDVEDLGLAPAGAPA